MSRSLVKLLAIKPPKELVQFLDDPPLVGDETRDDYNTFFAAIAAAAKPEDAIDWLLTKDVVDLAWIIRRERTILADIIKSAQKEIVLALLKATYGPPDSAETAVYRIFSAADEANRWANDPQARQEIGARLAEKGHPPTATLAQAYVKASSQIDAVDKRIAFYEVRRTALLREIDRRGEKLARALDKASSDIIDGEFSEAAE